MSKLKRFLKSDNARYIGIGLLVLFFSLKAFDGGNDINVYLHASRALWYGNDIYSGNPYNDYLYSPLFAILLWPIAFLPWEVSRVVWALFNLFIIFRLWKIFSAVLDHLKIHKFRRRWHVVMILASAGFIIHNLNLGQITVLILWMTLEGILLIVRDNKPWRGAALLALGISIKIIPLIALGYLFLKGKFRSIFYTILWTVLAFTLPVLFLGIEYNNELLGDWSNKINPTGERYVFENNNGCQSLNAVLPAFFYEFPADENIVEEQRPYERQIAQIPYSTLVVVLNVLRILLLLSVLLVVCFWNSGNLPFNTYWQLAYLMLVSLIVFPHQMKYSMLYFIPAVGYLLAYYFYKRENRVVFSTREWIVLSVAGFQVLIMTISGRDIIGETAVDFLDYFHFMGLSNISFVAYLLLLNPQRLESKLTISSYA